MSENEQQEQRQQHGDECECDHCQLANEAAEALDRLIATCLVYKGQHMMGAPEFITLHQLDHVTAYAHRYTMAVKAMVEARDAGQNGGES